MKLNSLSALSVLLLSTSALAGGYQLSEYSVTNLGRSFAGAGVVGDDYSALAFNPAAMNLRGTGAQLGANQFTLYSNSKGVLRDKTTGAEVPSAGLAKGKLREYYVLPHAFAQTKLNDVVTAGLGFYIPFGLGTHYNKNWYGASHALDSEISAMDVVPGISVKLNDQWSIGANVIFERMDAKLTNTLGAATNNKSWMKADGWGYGWSAGIMYKPFENTRFGITYRSAIDHKIKGRQYLEGLNRSGVVSTKLTMPEHVLISAYQKLGDWGLSASARWTRWSRFDILNIYSTVFGPERNVSQVDEKWKNVWMISAGVDYDINENWTVRTGLAWDEGAVSDYVHRTARVPDNDRWIASVGASYKYNNWQLDAGYSHLFVKTSRTWNTGTNSSNTVLDAKYNMVIDIVGLAAQYNF